MKSPSNPYVGPRPLTDREKLYGRDRELADLMDLLIAERIVLLYSPSGAGKSSLLQAGLMPAMRQRGFTVRNVMRLNTTPPPGLEDNRYSVSAMASLKIEGKPGDVSRLSLPQYLDANPNGEVLVFDQFEEVITADPFNLKAKVRFFDEIGEALRARGRWAVFAMREDYLARLDPYVRWVPTHLSNTFRLDLLSIDASIEAIRNPALNGSIPVNFTLEAARTLAGNLSGVDVQTGADLVGRFVEPVQLQVACSDLWDRLPEGTTEIVPEHIGKVANIDEALGQYYSDTAAKTSRDLNLAERSIREWFGEQLINRQGIRVQVLKGDGLESAAVDLLEQAHLVRSDSRLVATWVELAHDRLIKPVRANNAQWFEKNLNKVQKDSVLWEAQGRPQGLLVIGVELEAAQKWAREQPALTDAETRFLEASQAAQVAAVKEQKQQRRLRLLAIISTAVSIIAVAAGVIALQESRQSAESLDRARAQEARAKWQSWVAEGERALANTQQTRAENEAIEAGRQRRKAEDSSRDSLAARLLSEARQLSAQGSLHRAALLALESYRRAPRAEAYEALRTIGQQIAKPLYVIKTGPALGVRGTASPGVAEFLGPAGKITLLTSATGKLLPDPPQVPAALPPRAREAAAEALVPAVSLHQMTHPDAIPRTTRVAARTRDGLLAFESGKEVLRLTTSSSQDQSVSYLQLFNSPGNRLAELESGYRDRELNGGGYTLGTKQTINVYAGLLSPPSVFRCGDDPKGVNMQVIGRAGDPSFDEMVWSGQPEVLLVACQDGTIRGIEAPDWTDLSPITESGTFSIDGQAIAGLGGSSWITLNLSGQIIGKIPDPAARMASLGGQGRFSVFELGPQGSLGWFAEDGDGQSTKLGDGDRSVVEFGLDPHIVTIVEESQGRVYRLPGGKGEKGQEQRRFNVTLGTPKAASGDGAYLATSVSAKALHDVRTLPLVRNIKDDGEEGLAIIDTIRMRLVRPLLPLMSPSAAFSPYGRLVVIAGSDPILRILDLVTGKMHEFEIKAGVNRLRTHLAFSPDGRRLAVLSLDNLIHVLDLVTDTEPIRMAAPAGLTDKESPASSFSPTRFRFTADGKSLLFLVEGKWNSGIRRATLDPQALIQDVCQRVSRNLTPAEWGLYFGVEPYQRTCPVLNPAAMGQAE